MKEEDIIARLRSRDRTIGKHEDWYIVDGNYVNVRRKTEASFWRAGQRHEFGIPLRDWNKYRAWDRSAPTYSVILERSTGQVYCGRIQDLAGKARIYDGDKVDRGGTVFIPRDAYKNVT